MLRAGRVKSYFQPKPLLEVKMINVLFFVEMYLPSYRTARNIEHWLKTKG